MLYVVGTPIGNREDITLRALRVLQEADLILAEDTRHSRPLLQHHGIDRPLLSYHEHNEARRTAELLPRLQAGETMALISDAGMPCLSDPGQRLIRACREAHLPVEVVPGPSALVTALTGSGWPMEAFHFGGFLPNKSGRLQRELEAALARPVVSVYYETPHRILKTLRLLTQRNPATPVVVARELTKKFETFHYGTAESLLDQFEQQPPKGEITLLLRPPE